MRNVPVPLAQLPLNNEPDFEKPLLIANTTSLSACIVASAIYLSPSEPYFEAEFMAIMMPAFLTGYLVIISSQIFALYLKKPHVFLEICMSAAGVVGSGACGLFQFSKWIQWIVDTYEDGDHDFSLQELMVAIACFVNVGALIVIIYINWTEARESTRAHD